MGVHNNKSAPTARFMQGTAVSTNKQRPATARTRPRATGSVHPSADKPSSAKGNEPAWRIYPWKTVAKSSGGSGPSSTGKKASDCSKKAGDPAGSVSLDADTVHVHSSPGQNRLVPTKTRL